ncbi:TetR/AcrR family transcriptional regulator [Streptomyces sp. MAR4 CNX-425]|uniref:TetR/AcrR family transcriptional regulator n=1 Tax=Streptomyces sp. MAR4 CNX-425 TaxID=3406343 RepID=UPI003B50F74D
MARHRPSRPYHHGNLRRAVLDAALDVIADQGPGAVSLRDLARRAGVSHAAPAHHFGDRAGLLTAVAAEGNGLLAESLEAAADLADLGVRYVRFALAHPAYFQVMYQPHLLHADAPELAAARDRVDRTLRAAIAALPEAERGGPDPESARLAAWSAAHGFATLALSGSLDPALAGHDDPAEVFRALTPLMFNPVPR